MSIYVTIYQKLEKLGVIDFVNSEDDYRKSQVPSFMDLSIDKLSITGSYTDVSLQHYYEVMGDLVPDPDMVVRVYKAGVAKAISYQDSMQYIEVYPGGNSVNKQQECSQNIFLSTWLSNLIHQGHKLNKY